MTKYKKILRVHRNVFDDPLAEIKRLRAALRAVGMLCYAALISVFFCT